MFIIGDGCTCSLHSMFMIAYKQINSQLSLPVMPFMNVSNCNGQTVSLFRKSIKPYDNEYNY